MNMNGRWGKGSGIRGRGKGDGGRRTVAESVTHELHPVARGVSPKLHIEAYNDHRIAITRVLVGVSDMLSGTANFIWLILLAHPHPPYSYRGPCVAQRACRD